MRNNEKLTAIGLTDDAVNGLKLPDGALPRFMQILREVMNAPPKYVYGSDEYKIDEVERYNRKVGHLTGYDCKECLNRGDRLVIEEGRYALGEITVALEYCECRGKRSAIKSHANSGVAPAMNRFTFGAFETEHLWQQQYKALAEDFAHNRKAGQWFFASGQSGAGKTHLCVAILNRLMARGLTGKYVTWRTVAARLKGYVNDPERREEILGPLIKTDVLYIDDFLKTPKGESGTAERPTPGDLKLAFDVLNRRAMDHNKITIISTEHDLGDINSYDTAIAGRIVERSGDYLMLLDNDPEKNYRMRSVAV